MNLTSMKCKEATKHPLHHPHFLCHSPDQSTGPSSFWNFPHSLRSKHPTFICTISHTHRTRRQNTHGELRCPQNWGPHPPLMPTLSLPGTQSRRQEMSRQPHVQKFELRSPDKSEQDQSWAFISDLQRKVLPGEPHANHLVGAVTWIEPGGAETRESKGRKSVSVWKKDLQSQYGCNSQFLRVKGTVKCVFAFTLPL